MKIAYELTLNELINEHIFAMEKQRSSRQATFAYYFKTILFAALASVAVFLFTPHPLILGLLNFVFIVVIHHLIYPFSFKNYYRKFAETHCRRRLGDTDRTLIEIELLENGLRLATFGDEYIFSWQSIERIEEDTEIIRIFRKHNGITTIPKRALVGGEQTARFISLANYYKESAHNLLNDRNHQSTAQN